MKNPPKDIKRRWNLSARYKMTPERWQELFDSQGGRCAICRCVPVRPVVDHDHATGRVRGILCHGCNIILPAIEDEAFCAAALSYLERVQ